LDTAVLKRGKLNKKIDISIWVFFNHFILLLLLFCCCC